MNYDELTIFLFPVYLKNIELLSIPEVHSSSTHMVTDICDPLNLGSDIITIILKFIKH